MSSMPTPRVIPAGKQATGQKREVCRDPEIRAIATGKIQYRGASKANNTHSNRTCLWVPADFPFFARLSARPPG